MAAAVLCVPIWYGAKALGIRWNIDFQTLVVFVAFFPFMAFFALAEIASPTLILMGFFGLSLLQAISSLSVLIILGFMYYIIRYRPNPRSVVKGLIISHAYLGCASILILAMQEMHAHTDINKNTTARRWSSNFPERSLEEISKPK